MSKPATAAVRCYSLTLEGNGSKTLKAQEKHGKRLDRTSKERRVRKVGPLAYGGLDLRRLYDAHIDGVRLNASCKRPVLHFVVKMPSQVLVDGGDAPKLYQGKSKRDRQVMMATQAVQFINETHGGDAVFAARVDRDEAGELVVDVFASPRYKKQTKNRRREIQTEMWSSPTKFGKDLAIKHQAEIQSRHSESKGMLTGPRHVGIALQSEFAEFFERENGMKLSRKQKDSFGPDRLETEAYKAVQDDLAVVEKERSEVAAERQEVAAERQEVAAERQEVAEERQEVAAERQEVAEERAAIKDERIELAQDRQELISEQSQTFELRLKLQIALQKVVRWLKRPDLSQGARADAVEIVEEIGSLISDPEDPLEESAPSF
jgi:hypothetical protein